MVGLRDGGQLSYLVEVRDLGNQFAAASRMMFARGTYVVTDLPTRLKVAIDLTSSTIALRNSYFVRHGERQRLRELEHGAQSPILAVILDPYVFLGRRQQREPSLRGTRCPRRPTELANERFPHTR